MSAEIPVLFFVKLTEKAFAPSKDSENEAGFDLKSAYNYTIPPRGGTQIVKTDLQIIPPKGCYGRIAPLYGLDQHISIRADVVNPYNSQNVEVLIFNHGVRDFIIKEGDKIAQLICEQILIPSVIEVEVANSAPRGSGGFLDLRGCTLRRGKQ